ncbi:MAG TPA: sulfatase-like hydrolase/transferase [Propionicimonas sp.]|nr:sulfatase-like hydrolase/transferase [Propionicimonas sp.]
MVTKEQTTPERAATMWVVAGWVLIAVAVMLAVLAGWIRYHFGTVTFEQIVNNLPGGGGGTVGNPTLATEGLVVVIIIPVVVVAVIALLVARLKGHLVTKRRAKWVPTVAVLAALSVLLTVAGVPQFAIAQLNGQTIAPYYVIPQVTAAPKKPLNLITIYLESTENTLGDASIMGQNLLANLDQATATGWRNDRGVSVYEGGGWTMAGIVGTQCGIPLKNKLLNGSYSLNDFGETVDHYLPGTTCLGDVLTEQGYTSVFLGGAENNFAGKDTYFRDHGYGTFYGLDEWLAAGENPSDVSEWGLSDDRMIDHAITTVDRLHRASKPFNLTMLTLDTHEPAAIYPSCHTDDTVHMATAFKCSTKAVARFLNHLTRAGYLDDTVVMVMGDHLKGTGDHDDYRDVLPKVNGRTVVFRVHSPKKVAFTRDEVDQLSVLPTTLELLGFDIADGRAGVGVSFVGNHDLTGTALELPTEEYKSLLRAPSNSLYRQFWEQQ